jgi:hypothetical protein
MIYRVFRKTMPQVQIATIDDPNWPLLGKGQRIPLTVDSKDGLFTVDKVGELNMDANNKIVIDLWVNDFFPK